MRWVDLAGCGASVLVFMTFYMKDMIRLRTLALCSNVAFLLYACPLHLFPIIALHGALIPINVCRLLAACNAELFRQGTDPRGPDRGPGPIKNTVVKNVWSAIKKATGASRSLDARFFVLVINMRFLLTRTAVIHAVHPLTMLNKEQRAKPAAWTTYSRALVCAIGALVIVIGTFMAITTAPASRNEILFSGPVG